jgi:hypothetical protein
MRLFFWRGIVEVKIYDGRGNEVHSICLPGEFERIPHSRFACDKNQEVYFKGAGCHYFGHYILKPDPLKQYQLLEKVPIEYLGYFVMDPDFAGKTGIFFAKFQPPFSDPIGGCGIKETRIYEHSREFEKSGVDVVAMMPVLEDSPYLIYQLKYKDGRIKMENGQFRNAVLADLLLYMLETDWNFPWDKNVLGDINLKGLVTDVADLFKSEDLVHKFGTVYSFLFGLHSVGRLNGFCKHLGLKKAGLYEIPFRVVELLKARCNSQFAIGRKETPANYLHLMKDFLIEGKNCASLENSEFHEFAKRMYLQKLGVQEVST